MTFNRARLLPGLAFVLLAVVLLALFWPRSRSAHHLSARPSSHRLSLPVSPPPLSRWQTGQLEVVVLDCGQADCIVLRCPDGRVRVIDAGGSAEPLLAFLELNRDTEIATLVMTHPHADHIGGVPELLRRVPVREVLDAGAEHPYAVYLETLRLLDEKKIAYRQPRAGETLDWGRDVRVEVLHPDRIDYEDLNDVSLVLRVTAFGESLLFTGDASSGAERAMLSRAPEHLRSRVLKVGHHGSYTATSDAFLAAVSPRVAVISCGAGNPYGHPHDVVVDRLERAGVPILRTDLVGSVTVLVGADTFAVIAQKDGSPSQP